MKKWIVYLSCLLAGVGGFAGCDDDEYEGPLYFGEMADEEILFELKDVPARINGIDEGYVFISYSSDTLDVWWDDFSMISKAALPDEANDGIIGVSLDDYKTYDISVHSWIFVSAKVTNNERVLEGGDGIVRKAYLIDLKIKKEYKEDSL